MGLLTELTLAVGVVGEEELKKLQKDLALLDKETVSLAKSTLKYAAAMAAQGKGQKEVAVQIAKIIGSFSEAGLEAGFTAEQMKTATDALMGLGAKGLTAAQRVELLQKAFAALGVDWEQTGVVAKAFADRAGVAEAATKSLSARLKAQIVDISNLGKWWIRIIMFWGVASVILQPVFQLTNKLTEALFKESEAVLQTRDSLMKLTLTSEEYLRAVGEAEEGTKGWGARITDFFHVADMFRKELAETRTAQQEYAAGLPIVGRLYGLLVEGTASLAGASRLLKSEFWGLAVAMSQVGLQEKFLLEKTKQLVDLTTGPYIDATEGLMKSLWESSSSYDMYTRTLVAAGLVEQAAIDRISSHARKIGQLSIEIRDLNAAYDEERDALQNMYDMLRALDAENESFRQSMRDLRTAFRRDYEAQTRRTADRALDIWQDYRDALEDIEAEGDLKVLDIQQDFDDAMEDLAIDIGRRREDIDIDHARRQRDIREKFHRDMRRLEDRYAFDLVEAAIHRDAVAIRRLQRRFAYEKKERAQKYKEDQKDEYQRYQDDLKDLEKYQERKAEDIAKDRERAFRDLQTDLERRRDEAEKDRERALRDLETANEREEREMRISYKQQREDLKDAHEDRLTEIKKEYGKESILAKEQRRAEERLEARFQADLLKLLTGRHIDAVIAMADYANDICILEKGFTIDVVGLHTERRTTLTTLWNDFFQWMHDSLKTYGVDLPPLPPFPYPPGPFFPPSPYPPRPESQYGPTAFTAQMAERRPAAATLGPLGGPIMGPRGPQGLNISVTVRGEGIMFSSAFEDKLANKIGMQITKAVIGV